MLGDRLTVTADLEVCSPLHIGTGERIVCPDLVSEDDRAAGTNDPGPGLAVVATDHRGLPCIPGPSLKGALRSILRARDDSAWKRLFGVDRETSARRPADGLGMGRLLVRTAILPDAPAGTLGANWPHRNRVANGGTFANTRTRIDRDTGGVQPHKLFHQDLVMPGVRFRLSLCLLAPDDGDRTALAACLATLANPAGYALGKGRTAGAGRVRLCSDTLTATRQTLDPETLALVEQDETDDLRERVKNSPPRPAGGARRVLLLTADGPYLSRDPERSESVRKQDRSVLGEKERPAQIQPLSRDTTTPELLGSSLKGVLRARAAWLQALIHLREGKGDGTADDLDNPDKVFSLARNMTPRENLTVTERLFGVNGWRGLLRLEPPRTDKPGRRRAIHAVSLDRHSMAPLHGALFKTDAFVAPAFTVILTLERRPEVDEDLYTADVKFLDCLIADLTDPETPPLMVGHGTSKGYGWFIVARKEA